MTTEPWWLTNAATSQALATFQSAVLRPDPKPTWINDNLSIKLTKLLTGKYCTLMYILSHFLRLLVTMTQEFNNFCLHQHLKWIVPTTYIAPNVPSFGFKNFI